MRPFLTILGLMCGCILAAGFVLAEENGILDPLAGNYIMGNSAEIIAANAVPHYNRICFSTIDYGTITDTSDLEYWGVMVGQDDKGLYDSACLDISTGDFDGDAYDEIVAAWQGPDHSMVIAIVEAKDKQLSWSKAHVIESDTGILNQEIRLVVGNFDNDPEHEFVVAYTDFSFNVHIEIYETDESLNPTLKASVADELAQAGLMIGPIFDIAAGDFNSDGKDVIILAGHEPLVGIEYKIFIKAYEYDWESENILPRGTNASVIHNNNKYLQRIRLCSADFDGDAKDEIVLGFKDWSYFFPNVVETFIDDKYFAQPIELNIDHSQFEFDPSRLIIIDSLRRSYWGHHLMPTVDHSFSLIGADINSDGKDDLISANPFANPGYGPTAAISIYKWTESKELIELYSKSRFYTTNTIMEYNNRFIAVDDRNADTNSADWFPEIIIYNFMDQNIEEWKVALGPDSTIDSIYLNEVQLAFDQYSPVSIALGDFDGDAIRLGPPKHFTKTDIVQPLVVLNAPPIHYDILNETTHDLAGCYHGGTCDFEAIYNTDYTTGLEVVSEVHTDWGLSASIGYEGSICGYGVSAKLKASYGENFSKVLGSGTTVEVTTSELAQSNDRIYGTWIKYDIWEYPIFGRNDTLGHMLITEPAEVRHEWKSTTLLESGTHIPKHEVGNILSYPSYSDFIAENDITLEIKHDDPRGIDPNSSPSWTLRWEDVENDEAMQAQNIGLEVGASVSAAGVKVEVEGEYNREDVSTHKTSISEAISLEVYMGSLQPQYTMGGYSVATFYYWAENGALVVDYTVDVDEPVGYDNFWEIYYGSVQARPDPALILPLRYHQEKGLFLETDDTTMSRFSSSIYFEPPEPDPGDVITIKGKVHNFSLVPFYNDIAIQLYLGDPDKTGTLIEGTLGETEIYIAGGIGARKYKPFQMDWELPLDIPKECRIYALIDPNDEMMEIHENNNKGFGILFVPGGTSTNIDDIRENAIPRDYMLSANYPNPFNPYTTVEYRLPRQSDVRLTVYNILGQMVKTIVDESQPAGTYQVVWDGKDDDGQRAATGIYLYQLKTKEHTETRKMLLLK